MLYLTLSKKKINIIDEWKDLPLNKAMQVYNIDLPNVEDVFGWFAHLDKVRQMLAIFSNLTDDDMDKISPEELVHYYVTYALSMVQDLNVEVPKTYVPEGITEFWHKEKKYIMPKSLPIAGEMVLQHDTKVKPFVEASNLYKLFAEMRTEGLRVMPLFCASVVKEEAGEQWNDEVIVARSEAFADLPMNIVWEVFFCTSACITNSALNILEFMAKETEKVRRVSGTRLGRYVLRKLGYVETLKK